jgi:trans-2,3-dihydro-3-hydroxyanthranilate isomerase
VTDNHLLLRRATTRRRYVTADVFTDQTFGGNPLAVVLEAEGLSAAQMQSIATEFNYSETTFVLPPEDPAHTARVRIFTSRSEMPFAGHPNVGTAAVLAWDLQRRGIAVPEKLVFEELAGLVPIGLLREGGQIVGAELTAPQPLTVGPSCPVEDAAACLSLPASDIATRTHAPQILSVGLPFLVVEVASRDALQRCKPALPVHERVLPPLGTDGIYAWCRGPHPNELHARMFAPLDNTLEDAATGSAAAATIARLGQLGEQGTVHWRIAQGTDMGRPSLILGTTGKRAEQLDAVRVAGHVVPVMDGTLQLFS